MTKMPMKSPAILAAVALLFAWNAAQAGSKALFFASETEEESTRIALSVSDDGSVSGTKTWQPAEGHGARGWLDGVVNGDVIQVLYSYEIEGSEQSEEMVLKIADGKLLIGEGELVDGGDGRMNLKEPNKVGFTKSLEMVEFTEPKAGTAERKAIMDSMRVPVAEYAGEAVTFTGKIRVIGQWARFTGSVAATDGSPPETDGIAADMELDFAAFLFKDENGKWRTLHWGFAGDTSVLTGAQEEYPKAPWPLFEWVD
jgi:hypothetical protein